MNKRVSSRAIIIEDEKIYLMYRKVRKVDGDLNKYYSIPGGGVEENETNEEAVIREVKEELSLDVEVISYVGYTEGEDFVSHYFLCNKIGGELKLAGLEHERNSENNYYEIKKISLSDIDNLNILSGEMIKKAIM